MATQGTADILGHREILTRLWRAVSADALHHAYLFEGPPGIGKALVAHRLAMAANCTGETDPPPCGRCPSCVTIAAGTHPDVLRLEPDPERATATIPVDAVREVVRRVGYRRYNSRRRFVLVDPAEGMLPAAANALLKTLEEPAPGTGFVLIAANANALLPTILSRCQRVRFGAVPEAEITTWLEGRDHANAAHAARLSQGRPGAALALAEGLLAKQLDLRRELLDVLAGPLPGIFDWSARLTRGGRQLWMPRVGLLVAVVEDLLRDAVVRGSGSDGPLLNADIPETVDAWAGALWPGGLTVCQRALADLRDDLEVNVTGKTALDALLTRLRHELGGRGRG